ncbi:hypothetical protein ACSL103130_06440 [Actinomyces slackii]|uniref:Sensory transduction regulator n=1 Tax=Actinomyces slackii TaxID=52774 RepID=A0A3S4TBM5_9ACTO|nr:hypothetical protein [Actinomyces slackii]VEG74182.1 Uncharacterised protein [Actinomyces slackii]
MSAHPDITLERVEAWLSGEDLVFERVDDEILVDFPGCRIVFSLHGDGALLSSRGYWRGRFETDQAEELRALADSHHMRSNGPRMSVLRPEEGDHLLVGTAMAEYVVKGRSDEQLAFLLDLDVRMTMRFFADIEERYPALVTWGES